MLASSEILSDDLGENDAGVCIGVFRTAEVVDAKSADALLEPNVLLFVETVGLRADEEDDFYSPPADHAPFMPQTSGIGR
jgi:hypothetical protein